MLSPTLHIAYHNRYRSKAAFKNCLKLNILNYHINVDSSKTENYFFVNFLQLTFTFFKNAFYNTNLMSITLVLHFFCFLPSLFPVLQRSLRHNRSVWQEDYEHAHVVLRRSARVLRHAQLPHRYQQPVCDPAETWAPGCSDRPCRALQVD